MGKGLQNLIPGGNKLTKHDNNKEDLVISKESEESKESKDVAVSSDKNKSSSSNSNTEKKEASENDILDVKISLIIPNTEQPRKEFDDAAISELAESIKNYGII